VIARAETIAKTLGLRRAGREFTGACPNCNYSSGFTVTERGGKTLAICHAGGCSQAVLLASLHKLGLSRNDMPECHQSPAQRVTISNKGQEALAVWRRSRLAAGSLVEVYLRSRNYSGRIPSALRFTEGKHPADGRYHPMMIAAVSLNGQVVAVHRTFLRADGRGKAALEPTKMTLGPCRGAAVALAPSADVIAVAEGIETALSYMQGTGIPTWSALSAGGIRYLVLPKLVREVVIAADPDIPGIRAAHDAARRWLTEGRRVRLDRPPPGLDFNDLLAAS
jgi:putative DNA primase/helicase